MLYAALLGILIFLSGWGIVFIVSFVHAPTVLDAECQRTVRQLSEELDAPDKMLESHLTKLLGKVGKAGERIVCFVLLDDELSE